MTALASVTLDRSGLSLADLTIDSEGFGTYYVDKAGLGRVGIARRETFAEDSPWVHGRIRTSSVKEDASLSLTVRVQAASSSALNTAVEALEDALSQFVYDVTLVVDGVTKVYRGYPATIQTTDGLIAIERVQAFHEDFVVTIPVYPVAS